MALGDRNEWQELLSHVRCCVDVSTDGLSEDQTEQAKKVCFSVVQILRHDIGVDAQAPMLREVPEHRKGTASKSKKRYLRTVMHETDLLVLLVYCEFGRGAAHVLRLAGELVVPSILLVPHGEQIPDDYASDPIAFRSLRTFSGTADAIQVLEACLGDKETQRRLIAVASTKGEARRLLEQTSVMKDLEKVRQSELGLSLEELQRRTGMTYDSLRNSLVTEDGITLAGMTNMAMAVIHAALRQPRFRLVNEASAEEECTIKNLIMRVAFRERWPLQDFYDFAIEQHPSWLLGLLRRDQQLAENEISRKALEWRELRLAIGQKLDKTRVFQLERMWSSSP